ncbi:hypothetical protein JCM17823_14510 [Halorubrum gandharaense]
MRGAGAATAVGAAAGASGSVAADEDENGGDEEPEWPGQVDGANLGTYEDARGQDEVTVMVGADDDGLAFDATKIWIDPGTTVTFEWTGDGGSHNVEHVDGPAEDLQSDTTDEEGFTYEFEFTEEHEGITTYVCAPHEQVDMFGGIAVGDEVPTVEPGSEAAGVVFVPQGARALGIATFIAMVSTLGLAFVFMKYGGTITSDEV